MMDKKLYNLTNPQKSILLTEEFYKGTNINNICGTAIIENELDFDLLKKAISIVAKNHDSFNLKLSVENNEIKQYLSDVEDIDVEIIDINYKDEISKIENDLMNHIFDIYNGDLFCFKIFRFKDNTGGFMLNIHHLFADSWTLGVTAKDIVRVYSRLLNKNEIIKNEDFSYVDYIYSEKEYMSSDKFIKDKEYWQSIFNTIPEQASIPGSVANYMDTFSCIANRKTFNVDKSLMDKINDFCKTNRVSVFNFFMGLYAIYIGRVSSLDDFVIGTPILNRATFNEKNTTGMFINTAPLRVKVNDNLDFKSFVSNIAKDSLGMLRHQKYYYQNILEDLRKNNPNLPNLYNVLISYQVTKANTEEGLNYTTRWAFNGNTSDDIDIHLSDLNCSGSLDIAYDYKINKYTEDDILAIHNRILHIINQIINYDDICLKDIEIVTDKEKNDILYKFNDTTCDYDVTKNIVSLWEEQVSKTPNKVALVCNGSSLTYDNLNKRANMLAHLLVKSGVCIGDIVGIMINRSLDLITGLLAILKCGATYLPIDPEYPTQRISYMLENSGAKLVLVNSTTIDLLPNTINTVDISFNSDYYSLMSDSNLNIEIPSSNLMYLIYTSGSTGTPKGVMLTHKNIHNFILGTTNKINFDSNKTMVSVTTVCFDIFVLEVWCSLVKGLTVVLANEREQNDIELLNKLCIENKVNMIQTTPSRFTAFFKNSSNLEFFDNITDIMVGGEALTSNLLEKFKSCSKANIYNMYGPTETAVWSTIKDLTNDKFITIGTPISNTSCYILDKNMKLLPPNVIGELYIGGDGVSAGYFMRDDLTKEKFISSPFGNGYIYNTNDLACFNTSGELIHFGRSDFQVKIRGYRIELGEIENTILQFKDITSCAVVCHNRKEKQILCAYYTELGNIDINKLKSYLLTKLPTYMIPSYFIKLEKMPYTPNGKIDKKSLSFELVSEKKDIVLPKNELEKQVYDIIDSIVHSSNFSMDDTLFNIGMDSIGIIQLSSKLETVFGITISIRKMYDFNSINDLVNYIDLNNTNLSKSNISTAPDMDYYPLSSAQKRIYFACKKLGDNSLAYNITGGLLVNKVLDKTKLVKAIHYLVNRHSSFRTSYSFKANEVVQHIKDNVNIDVNVFNDTTDNLNNILQNCQKPFDLEKDLLLRCSIYYLDNTKTLLLIDSHHIALDGVSLDIFIKEFCNLYNNETLEDLKIDYKDFAVWENNFINSDKIKELEDYWVNKFKDSSLPAINLPYDYVNSNEIHNDGSRVNYKMDKELFETYENFAKSLTVSNYTLFLSVLLILLYKYTNQDELIVGSTTVGRENNELYNIIGTFVNNIVIDAKMKSTQSFVDFVKYINTQVINDLAHQAYPYDMLVKKLSNLNGNYKDSLFDVSFTYQNANRDSHTIDNEEIEILDMYSNTSKFNLLLEIQPKNYTFNFEYNNSLFKKQTIESLLEHYLFVLSQVCKDSSISIDNINIITDKELKLLEQFNNTYAEINDDTFVSLFENEVQNNPDNIAVICNDEALTYSELNKKANSLAHLLIKRGIGANDIVCIMTNRSFETIVCMLGILKAGAAFFNVDPTYPIERTKYYISDSKTKYVLTQKELKDKVSEIENCIEIDLDNEDIYNYNFDNPNVKINKEDLSYIIYTSGSTGTPKGVMLNQVGLANMVKAMTKVLDYLKEGNKHAIASVTSTPFDIFVYEIVVSLAHGLKVVMANNAEHRNPKLLDALIKKHNVDVMTVTPSLMKINYDNREPDTALVLVKNMVFGGEPLPEKFVNDLRALADDITIYNIYGPSEITVLSNVQNLDGEKEITVGPPIMNTQIHVLDKNMNRVPIGVVGEIYISGIQVGLGYIGKDELTKERFMDNPFGEGKIYKSGDIGRWTFDGKVQCLGRVDHQIKLRGLRIELGEIENVIQNIPGISASVVNKVEIDSKEVLCGYYVADSSVEESLVKETLRNALPYYMVPTYIIRLDEMPYTINRKIDRKALPLPELHKTLSTNKVNINELSSNEEKLLQIWKNILNIDNIDINDNFFDIGGDSISAINMQIEALKYGLNFEYADIFNYPTVKQLCSKLPNNEISFLQNYDYSKINAVLSKNTTANLSTIKSAKINNILLIGSTGFLGAHIIDEFMKNNSGIIYCLIRPKDGINPIERLKSFLAFYFGNTYLDDFSKRIHVISGDITKENLGLSVDNYQLLVKNIDVVINSGAIVKHFGLKKEFELINVLGTKNVVEFCKKENKRLLHISTMSVSGSGEKEEAIEETPENVLNKKQFYENTLYIGQNIKGIYTTTKYEAELIVLEAIYDGLDAQILRLGNITNRYRDGIFQHNVENNAFAKRLKSFIEIGAVPKYMLKHSIELTPVDLAANAIVHILNYTSDCNVFHIYNTKLLSITLLLETLRTLDFEILPISDEMMSSLLNGILTDDRKKDILSGIIYDLDDNKKLIYTYDVRLHADFTEQYLNKISFEWKEINSEYIIKYINYFKKIKFIDNKGEKNEES